MVGGDGVSEGIECPICKEVGDCFIDEDEDNLNNLWCNSCGVSIQTAEGVEVTA
jgi:transcription elongation factor Elf1